MKEVIGFVGLGQMGQPMALNLLKAGFEIRVFDLHEERVAPLVALGAYQAFRLGEVTEPGGIVLSMVPDDRALLQVALGEGGILRRIGQEGIHISLSTISPEVSAQIARLYEHQGSHYLVATVLGRPEVAEAAHLSIFLSGNPAAKARVLPLLRVLGSKVYDLGERVEEANVVEQWGAERGQFLRMLVESPLFKGEVYEGYGSMIGGRDYSDARFPVTMGLKDVELVLQTAEQVAVPLPYARIVHEHLLAAKTAGRSYEDWSVLADFVAQAVAGEVVAAQGSGTGQAVR